MGVKEEIEYHSSVFYGGGRSLFHVQSPLWLFICSLNIYSMLCAILSTWDHKDKTQ